MPGWAETCPGRASSIVCLHRPHGSLELMRCSQAMGKRNLGRLARSPASGACGVGVDRMVGGRPGGLSSV
jgi:hypothetical protein